jgi:hypothetical protein
MQNVTENPDHQHLADREHVVVGGVELGVVILVGVATTDIQPASRLGSQIVRAHGYIPDCWNTSSR